MARAKLKYTRKRTAPNNLHAVRPIYMVIWIYIIGYLGGSGFGALQRAPHPHSPRPGWPRATSHAGDR